MFCLSVASNAWSLAFLGRSSWASALGSTVWNCSFPKPQHPLGTYLGTLVLIISFSGSFLQTHSAWALTLWKFPLKDFWKLQRQVRHMLPLRGSCHSAGYDHFLLMLSWVCSSLLCSLGCSSNSLEVDAVAPFGTQGSSIALYFSPDCRSLPCWSLSSACLFWGHLEHPQVKHALWHMENDREGLPILFCIKVSLKCSWDTVSVCEGRHNRIPRLDGLDPRGHKSKIKVSAGLVSAETFLPGHLLSVSSHCFFSEHMQYAGVWCPNFLFL